jgi:site-specific recombinase XerD
MTDVNWRQARRAWLSGQSSEHTARAYQTALADFERFIAPEGLGDVGGADVAEWKVDLVERGLASATVAQRLAAVSAYYQFCMTTFTDGDGKPLAQFNPVIAVDRPEVQRYGKSRPMTIEQLTLLFAQVDETVMGLRDKAMLMMAVYTGRRSAEIRNLRVGDIQHTMDGRVRYHWSGKRGTSRWDDLPSPVWQAIQLYLAASGRQAVLLDEPVFISHNGHGSTEPLSSEWFNAMVRDYAFQAGLPSWIHAHTLRHTASALRLAAGRSVLEINRLLCHSSLRTTQVYLQALGGFTDDGWHAVAELMGGATQAGTQQRRSSESSTNNHSQSPWADATGAGAMGGEDEGHL